MADTDRDRQERSAPVFSGTSGKDYQLDDAVARLVVEHFGPKFSKNPGEVQFERFFAALGEHVHGRTYGAGLDDQGTAEWVSAWSAVVGGEMVEPEAAVMLEPAGPLQTRFAARWFDQAMPVLLLPDTYAAALMVTDAPETLVADLVPPWRAFTIRIGEGVLPYETRIDYRGVPELHGMLWKTSVTRVNVLYESIPQGNFWTLEILSGCNSLILHRIPTADLLRVSEAPEMLPGRANTPKEHRVQELIANLVIGVCLALVGNVDATRETVRRGKRAGGALRRSKDPAVRLIRLGEPMTVDLRAEVRSYAETGIYREGKSPTVQTLVRWHWKRQHHGPRNSLVKWIRVEPYWRGDEQLPVLVRAVKVCG